VPEVARVWNRAARSISEINSDIARVLGRYSGISVMSISLVNLRRDIFLRYTLSRNYEKKKKKKYCAPYILCHGYLYAYVLSKLDPFRSDEKYERSSYQELRLLECPVRDSIIRRMLPRKKNILPRGEPDSKSAHDFIIKSTAGGCC